MRLRRRDAETWREGGMKISLSPCLPISPSGFTLIELVITVAVLAILTLGVVPLVQVSVKRQKEEQLRATLREMREAIDQFHREAVAGGQTQVNQQPGQPQPSQPIQPGQPPPPGNP